MEIGAWGDSITYGAGDIEGLGWVGRLRHKFFDGDITSIYNRGVCGDTTENLLKRFVVEAESIGPETILFAVGSNDSKFFPAEQKRNLVPLKQFQTNLKMLIESARKFSDNVILVGLTQVDEEADLSPSRFSNVEIQRYDSFLKKFAEGQQLKFVDMFDVLDPQKDLYDGLHPNAQGYEKLANVVLAAIQ